jgi:ADP-dependent NAD(P)H-hydrate dehydratase / NAD(P)H-hydrate epimerase
MSLPVISISQMREWEAASWAAGLREEDVIRQVGIATAKHALRLTGSNDAILILAGKGHNGDDARAALVHLSDRRVGMFKVESPDADLPKLDTILEQRPALVIDGLFGIGLNRPLDDAWQKFVSRLNAAQLPVLSIDMPSGLNADTGESMGAAVKASVTLTVGTPKRGLLQPAAWPFVGRLEVAADVGLIPCPHTSELQWTLPSDFGGFPPGRIASAHKSSFGHLAIVAGSMGYHGAAVLATRGAQRAQPGLVTLFTEHTVYHPAASQLQSAMVNAWSPDLKLGDEYTAWLIGPGLAAKDLPDEMKFMTRRLWREMPVTVVVDASGLDWLVQGSTQRDSVRVMTPHPGEAARMLKATVQQVQADRPAAVRELSRLHGDCWVVLKGHQTLIGRSSGDVFVNPSGNPHLAQGGSGDVLAGFIAGLLAQPAMQRDAARAIRWAVWQHGAAADSLQSRHTNWIIEDLAAEIGDIRNS